MAEITNRIINIDSDSQHTTMQVSQHYDDGGIGALRAFYFAYDKRIVIHADSGEYSPSISLDELKQFIAELEAL